MPETTNEVRDVSTELWIKILSGLAMLSLLLGGFIGSRAINKLDKIGDTLAALVVFVKTNSGEITLLKVADKEILIKVDGISKRVDKVEYKLEGAK